MNARESSSRRSIRRRLIVGTVISAGAIVLATQQASAATTASFRNGVLTVNGDSGANTVAISRNAAGTDPGQRRRGRRRSVATPTVANTTLIQIFGLGGNDTLTLNEANGALPRANLFGGPGNDTRHGRLGRRPAVRSGRQRHPRWARAASTSCSAAATTTPSPAATPTTRRSARAATTG